MITLYPCLYGWKQFYSTHPNHWCACAGPTKQISHDKLYLSCVEIKDGLRNNCYLAIIQNNLDVPSDRFVNFMGWINDYNNYYLYHGQVYINSKSKTLV